MIEDGGPGLFGFETDPPDACLDFIAEQMIRFGMPVSSRLATVLTRAAENTFYFCNWSDPYVLFTRGVSDVKLSDDWANYFYEVRRDLPSGRIIFKTNNPQDVEVYELALAEGERAFRIFLAHDFLGYQEAIKGQGAWGHVTDIIEALIHSVDDEIEMVGFSGLLKQEELEELRSFCTRVKAGIRHVDVMQMEFYFKFAAWAAFVWLVGPPGREFRYKKSDLYHAVYEDGEALLTEHSIFGRGDFRKTARPVNSCHKCHIESWCLENTVVNDRLDFICESCATAGMPVMPPANCGFRLCRLPQCQHHPMFTFDPNRRLHETMKAVGQLTAGSRSSALLSGSKDPRKLLT